MKKRRRLLFILILLFAAGELWVIAECHILPYTRRWFISYASFSKKTDGIIDLYPKELPSSAENIRYFYYTGRLDKKTGISFTVSEKEYPKLKETYLSSYTADEDKYRQEFQQAQEDYQMKRRTYEPGEKKWYVFDQKVTPDFLKEEHLDYLEEIMYEKADNYTVLAYVRADGGEHYDSMYGVLCNDETNEIVMFAFKDTFRKEKQ